MERISRILFATRAVFGVALAVLIACGMSVAAESAGKGFPLRSSAVPYGTASNQVTAAPVPYETPVTPVNPKSGHANAAPVVTATPAATAAATTAAFEKAPITFAGSEKRRTRGTDEPKKGYTMPSIGPALFAVFAVCVVFGVILHIMKKYIPGHRQMFSHPAMELLGRTHLDQKRFVTLLRVGRRLVVVGVCAEEMRTLSEITDEGEITEIMEVARPKTEVGLTIFQKLFQRNVVEAEAEQTRALANEKVAELDAQMSALRDRVRSIRDDDRDDGDRDEKPERRHRQFDAVG